MPYPEKDKDKKKRPGLGIMIAVGKPNGDGPKARSPEEPPEQEAMEHQQPPPQQSEQMGGDEGIPPEAVGFRTGQETCGGCVYMGEDGSCSKLRISVAPEDSCMLFRAKEQQMPEHGMEQQPQQVPVA